MTPGLKDKPARKTKLSKVELEKQLDSALRDTFPASDPVSVGEVSGETPERPADRQAPAIDKALVEKLAKQVSQKKRGEAAR
ncbi:hypothetical protein W911_01280 [Hyphomicrobium nitrativorans NL23]|uniref:Uncharacterized protein n=1 Tax=Hyphomicrobium nitrativorans NL23 TaxID=1029756 RepID=V5S9C4_9HYPH|nr:hypothetical protein [Hyphomicrobium nitrativorans]AHB47336.1 hypothetical protein W911_01280 [Hyphomicrobium nitrativorans NL23]